MKILKLFIVAPNIQKLMDELRDIIASKKYMFNYLKKIKDFNDNDVEDSLNQYIIYHNNSKKCSTKYSPNEIRDIK